MNRLERYVVRWYVPDLGEWIDVATERGLEAARQRRHAFQLKLENRGWGVQRVAIVRVVEEEVQDG